MNDLALKAAEQKLGEIEQALSRQRNVIADANAEISRLQGQRGEIASWIEMWHTLAGKPQVPVAAERSEIGLPVSRHAKRKRPNNPDKSVVVDKALEIIRERDEPMGRKALFVALAENGIVLEGTDPQMVLSTMLWRSKDRIQRLPAFGYWPAGETYEPHEQIKNVVNDSLDGLLD